MLEPTIENLINNSPQEDIGIGPIEGYACLGLKDIDLEKNDKELIGLIENEKSVKEYADRNQIEVKMNINTNITNFVAASQKEIDIILKFKEELKDLKFSKFPLP